MTDKALAANVPPNPVNSSNLLLKNITEYDNNSLRISTCLVQAHSSGLVKCCEANKRYLAF